MNKGMRKLFLVELRRQWTVAALLAPWGLALLSFLILLTMARSPNVYDVARAAAAANMNFVVPLATCLCAVGIVANDVKEGWLRTLLIRPISRQQYLLIKLAVVNVSVIISVFIAGVLPNIIVTNFLVKGTVQLDLVRVLSVHVLFLLHASLLLSILTFISCWLPGVFNVVVLMIWGLAASIAGEFIRMMYWADKWLTILKDYFFPSGFSDAVDVTMGGMGIPTTELAWGFGALAIFLALAFWSVTMIQVDKSLE